MNKKEFLMKEIYKKSEKQRKSYVIKLLFIKKKFKKCNKKLGLIKMRLKNNKFQKRKKLINKSYARF